MMEKIRVYFPFVVFILVNVQFITGQDWLDISKEALLDLRNALTYDNSISDLVFLVDTSGSLSASDYDEEITFVTNLLNEISVDMQATRVEVIPFGRTASQFITQISSPDSSKNKCTFNAEFKTMSQSINGYTTNMRDAFQLAWEVCLNNGLKRVPLNRVKTVVFLLTDGKWNTPYGDSSPVSRAQSLLAGDVEIFAIGVGNNIDYGNLESLVQDPDKHAFLLENFDQFAELATYLRGGMLLSFPLMSFFLSLITKKEN